MKIVDIDFGMELEKMRSTLYGDHPSPPQPVAYPNASQAAAYFAGLVPNGERPVCAAKLVAHHEDGTSIEWALESNISGELVLSSISFGYSPTKHETYNAAMAPHGLSTWYDKFECEWVVEEFGREVGTFLSWMGKLKALPDGKPSEMVDTINDVITTFKAETK